MDDAVAANMSVGDVVSTCTKSKAHADAGYRLAPYLLLICSLPVVDF